MAYRVMCAWVVLVLGCGGDGDDEADRTAEFATMTTEQLRVVIEMSSGAGVGSAYLAMLGAEIDAVLSSNSCPTRTYVGSVMTLEANGCTAEDGTTYSGRVVASNAITLRDLAAEEPLVDPKTPMSLVFDQFGLSGDDGALSIDGWIEQSSPTAHAYRSRSTLSLTSGDWSFQEEMSTGCEGRGEDNFTCDIDRAVFELSGLGRFTAEGSFGRLQGDPVGTLELRGRQPLRLELGAGPCYQFAIGDDGADSGEICWDEE